jgi:hypothetical protein
MESMVVRDARVANTELGVERERDNAFENALRKRNNIA